MKIIPRETFKDDELFAEIMRKEAHHDHEIVQVEGDRPRWKEDPRISKLVDDMGGMNNVVNFMYSIGLTKNSEEYRKLYRDIGYSIYGYWEIFYFRLNNEDADEYKKDI